MKGIFFTLILCSLISCVDYSEVPVPAYLYIPDMRLQTVPGEGSNSNGFKDVWVFVDNQYFGAYEIPIKVPITKIGKAKVELYAGIRTNGVLSQPMRYPMTAPYEIEINFEEKKTDTVHPIVRYYAYNKYPFIEDFDRQHFFHGDIDQDVLTQIALSSGSDAFEGSNSGEIIVTKENPLMAVQYDYEKEIKVGPNSIMIELNYKTDIPFEVGLIGYTQGVSPIDLIFGTLKPKANWTKIYFDFTDLVKSNQAKTYRLAMRTQFDTSIAKAKQQILIDNFKLIYQ